MAFVLACLVFNAMLEPTIAGTLGSRCRWMLFNDVEGVIVAGNGCCSGAVGPMTYCAKGASDQNRKVHGAHDVLEQAFVAVRLG